jgi:hypothetical protein
MRFTRAGLALLGALALSSCGANGPFGLNPQPSGGFVVTSQQSGKVLTTSLANPFIVSGGSFAIQVTEPHLSGPPNVRITAWTAPGNVPCFEPHLLPGTNVFQFTADNGATQSSTPAVNPCSPFAFAGGYSTSEETVTFTDNHGNTGNFYYQIANSTTGSGTGATSNIVATIALAWDGEVPTTGGTCGAYLLLVTAFDSTGAQIIGQAYANPITLSTSNLYTSGFSTATSGVAPAPPPAGENCTDIAGQPIPNPGGTPTLVVPNTTTPSVVYWQPAAAGSGPTVITATAIGATQISTTITISNVAKKPLSVRRK